MGPFGRFLSAFVGISALVFMLIVVFVFPVAAGGSKVLEIVFYILLLPGHFVGAGGNYLAAALGWGLIAGLIAAVRAESDPELAHTNRCLVCGWHLGADPWSEELGPDFDCACCGCQFEVDDASPAKTREFREAWLAAGAQWRDPESRPERWNCERQLNRVPRHPLG